MLVGKLFYSPFFLFVFFFGGEGGWSFFTVPFNLLTDCSIKTWVSDFSCAEFISSDINASAFDSHRFFENVKMTQGCNPLLSSI